MDIAGILLRWRGVKPRLLTHTNIQPERGGDYYAVVPEKVYVHPALQTTDATFNILSSGFSNELAGLPEVQGRQRHGWPGGLQEAPRRWRGSKNKKAAVKQDWLTFCLFACGIFHPMTPMAIPLLSSIVARGTLLYLVRVQDSLTASTRFNHV